MLLINFSGEVDYLLQPILMRFSRILQNSQNAMNCVHLQISMHTISFTVCMYAVHACMKFSVCLQCMHAFVPICMHEVLACMHLCQFACMHSLEGIACFILPFAYCLNKHFWSPAHILLYAHCFSIHMLV